MKTEAAVQTLKAHHAKESVKAGSCSSDSEVAGDSRSVVNE